MPALDRWSSDWRRVVWCRVIRFDDKVRDCGSLRNDAFLSRDGAAAVVRAGALHG